MDVDAVSVNEIVSGNCRFASPWSEPCGYYIWTRAPDQKVDVDTVKLYLEKLAYAVRNVDMLMRQAYLGFPYPGKLPERLWRKLAFDSFVLVPEIQEIGCCLTNSDFLFGHFVECRWDYDWNLLSVWYC